MRKTEAFYVDSSLSNIRNKPCLNEPPEQMIGHLEQVLSRWLSEHNLFECYCAYGCLASETLPIPSQDLRLIRNACSKRRSEFIGGRWCAHRALEEIGLAACALPITALGSPLWPMGAIGSITHDGGICLALAALSQQTIGLGIDLFDVERTNQCGELVDLFLTSSEIQYVRRHWLADAYARLFSAKESVVKAISSSVGRLIDLREIEITLTGSYFSAVIAGYENVIEGRCHRDNRFILSYASLDAPLCAKSVGCVQGAAGRILNTD